MVHDPSFGEMECKHFVETPNTWDMAAIQGSERKGLPDVTNSGLKLLVYSRQSVVGGGSR